MHFGLEWTSPGYICHDILIAINFHTSLYLISLFDQKTLVFQVVRRKMYVILNFFYPMRVSFAILLIVYHALVIA